MDPNANLAELLQLANRHSFDGVDDSEGDIERMSELILALDEWIRKGGFLPARWERK